MISALNIAQTGLNASKYAVENVANNITNESTPGYKKRVVNFNEINNLSDLPGQGVKYSLTRITSEFLYSNLMTETSKYSYNEEVSQILQNAEALFTETEDSGLSANLNRYYQSVENLRSEPSNEIYQANLANSGKFLVESMQKLYEGIERIELVKEEELRANVDKVNSILEDIGKINEQMSKYDETSIELLDKRDNLEAELTKYVDIEVTNFDNEYELKIAGQTAVRYSTNIRSISLETENIPQTDRFSVIDDDGVILSNIKYNDDLSLRTFQDGDVITYNFNSTSSVSITIGTAVTGLDYDGNTVISYTPQADGTDINKALALAINNDPNMRQYVTAYNGNPEYDKNGDLIIPTEDKYLVVQSDEDGTAGAFESRISFQRVDEDSDITRENIYKSELSSTDASSKNSLNIFGSEINLSSGIIKAQLEFTDSTSPLNKLQDFKDKLDTFANTLSDINNSFYKNDITGNYIYGAKAGDQFGQDDMYGSSTANITISDPSDISSVTVSFGNNNVTITDTAPSTAIADATTYAELATALQNEIQGMGYTDITVSENSTSTGILFSDSQGREFSTTFEVLDSSSTDVSETIKVSEAEYEYSKFELNLFSGSNVKSLSFNSEVINNLDQTDLDYLASLQWKDDVSFDMKAQNPNDNDSVSFSEFYQSIRVSVSSQKESADFVLSTQAEVKQSLQVTYDSLVKVDKDEEMTALIQFQAAYTASAKVITVVDEMLQTLLGIKR